MISPVAVVIGAFSLNVFVICFKYVMLQYQLRAKVLI
jgi:hypothetical protein